MTAKKAFCHSFLDTMYGANLKYTVSNFDTICFYTIHYVYGILYTIHYTLYTIHYTLYTIHYTLYTIHYMYGILYY